MCSCPYPCQLHATLYGVINYRYVMCIHYGRRRSLLVCFPYHHPRIEKPIVLVWSHMIDGYNQIQVKNYMYVQLIPAYIIKYDHQFDIIAIALVFIFVLGLCSQIQRHYTGPNEIKLFVLRHVLVNWCHILLLAYYFFNMYLLKMACICNSR